MRTFFCILFLFTSFITFGQSTALKAPRIQWQRCLGGSARDVVTDAPSTMTVEERPLCTTSDNGYLLGGAVSSNDGDIASNHGGFDIWLTRLNQHGSTLWKKSYGGTANEQVSSIQETMDGGFIVVGSTSSNNGDVSGNHGGSDVWVLRIDGSGNILWQKCLGGSNSDKANQVKITADNGYIVTGFTRSRNGDVSGNHLGTDSTDVWVIKLNSLGAIDWQKCLGGSASDVGVSVDILNDGTYVLANTTSSNNGDVSGNHGSKDIWMVKLSADGIILWQKCLGGSSADEPAAIRQVSDGGLILVGCARSHNGDVTDHIGAGTFDEPNGWIVKLDPIGNISWSKCYGSSFGGHRFNDIKELPNGDFVVCGFTDNLGGGNLESLNPAQTNAWLIQITSAGAIVWQNTFGASGFDTGAAIVNSPDGGFLMLGIVSGIYDYETNKYDVSGNHGPAADLWVVKFGLVNTIKGIVYLDKNLNGNKDLDDPVVSGVLIKSTKGNTGYSSISINGQFANIIDTGNYVTTVENSPYFVSDPASRISNFTTYNNLDSFSIALRPIPGKRDLTINIVQINVARPGFDLSYKISYKNAGTDTVPSGQILLKKDSLINFVSAIPAQSSINGDTIKWNYDSLKPVDTASIVVNFRIQSPPAVQLGDTLTSLAIISPIAGDLTPFDDTALVKQVVQGSSDPNDKSENLAGKISLDSSFLIYTIRFQNTGTDTAFIIVVRDTLHDKLDWSSFQMVEASHPYQLDIKSQNQLTWSFKNALLVDSSRNEPASHGYISYRVKPKSNLVIGDIIRNTASIYFDYNLPVQTNTQETEVVMNAISNPQVGAPTITSFSPANGGTGTSVTIIGANFTGALAVSFGGIAASSYTVNSATSISAVVGTGTSGSVTVTTPGGTATLTGFTYTVVTAIDPVSGNSLGIRLYPNPTNGHLTIDTLKLSDNWETLEIFNSDGKQKLANFSLKNRTRVSVNLEHFANGFYTAILRRKSGTTAVMKFLKL